jgi:hypothetical protein
MRKALVAVAVVVMLGWVSNRAMAVCGDGVVDGDDECDLGGTCIGGSAAGTACHVGDATCTGGTCTTFGGQGCAANCTTEHDVPYSLVPGELDGLNVVPGTSGVAIASDFLSIPLPLGATCNGGDNANQPCTTNDECPGGTCVQSQQVLTVGKERNGQIPVVVKAASVKYPGIPVSTLACGCIHGIASKTCGGTLFEPDGHTLSDNCTPGFSDGDSVCAGKSPCAFVHGDGNTASGVIGCAGGLDGTDLVYEQDSGGSSGACAAPNTCPATVVLSGHGGPGSARVAQTLGITAALGGCTGSDPGTYGPDGVLCTDDDPSGGIISVAGTLPAVTGTATAVVHNANGSDGSDLGPVTATGAPFSCYALECGDKSSAAGGGLVGAFTFVHLDTVGDVAVTAQLFADGTLPTVAECPANPPAGCAGDCGGDGEVTVDEIIILVNIALGSAQPSACPSGIPAGTEVDITLIVKAVGFALNACPAA